MIQETRKAKRVGSLIFIGFPVKGMDSVWIRFDQIESVRPWINGECRIVIIGDSKRWIAASCTSEEAMKRISLAEIIA